MKAILVREFGGPEVLLPQQRLAEVRFGVVTLRAVTCCAALAKTNTDTGEVAWMGTEIGPVRRTRDARPGRGRSHRPRR